MAEKQFKYDLGTVCRFHIDGQSFKVFLLYEEIDRGKITIGRGSTSEEKIEEILSKRNLRTIWLQFPPRRTEVHPWVHDWLIEIAHRVFGRLQCTVNKAVYVAREDTPPFPQCEKAPHLKNKRMPSPPELLPVIANPREEPASKIMRKHTKEELFASTQGPNKGDAKRNGQSESAQKVKVVTLSSANEVQHYSSTRLQEIQNIAVTNLQQSREIFSTQTNCASLLSQTIYTPEYNWLSSLPLQQWTQGVQPHAGTLGESRGLATMNTNQNELSISHAKLPYEMFSSAGNCTNWGTLTTVPAQLKRTGPASTCTILQPVVPQCAMQGYNFSNSNELAHPFYVGTCDERSTGKLNNEMTSKLATQLKGGKELFPSNTAFEDFLTTRDCSNNISGQDSSCAYANDVLQHANSRVPPEQMEVFNMCDKELQDVLWPELHHKGFAKLGYVTGNGTGERSELNSEAQVGHNHGNSDQENTGRKEVLQEEAVKGGEVLSGVDNKPISEGTLAEKEDRHAETTMCGSDSTLTRDMEVEVASRSPNSGQQEACETLDFRNGIVREEEKELSTCLHSASIEEKEGAAYSPTELLNRSESGNESTGGDESETSYKSSRACSVQDELQSPVRVKDEEVPPSKSSRKYVLCSSSTRGGTTRDKEQETPRSGQQVQSYPEQEVKSTGIRKAGDSYVIHTDTQDIVDDNGSVHLSSNPETPEQLPVNEMEPRSDAILNDPQFGATIFSSGSTISVKDSPEKVMINTAVQVDSPPKIPGFEKVELGPLQKMNKEQKFINCDILLELKKHIRSNNIPNAEEHRDPERDTQVPYIRRDVPFRWYSQVSTRQDNKVRLTMHRAIENVHQKVSGGKNDQESKEDAEDVRIVQETESRNKQILQDQSDRKRRKMQLNEGEDCSQLKTGPLLPASNSGDKKETAKYVPLPPNTQLPALTLTTPTRFPRLHDQGSSSQQFFKALEPEAYRLSLTPNKPFIPAAEIQKSLKSKVEDLHNKTKEKEREGKVLDRSSIRRPKRVLEYNESSKMVKKGWKKEDINDVEQGKDTEDALHRRFQNHYNRYSWKGRNRAEESKWDDTRRNVLGYKGKNQYEAQNGTQTQAHGMSECNATSDVWTVAPKAAKNRFCEGSELKGSCKSASKMSQDYSRLVLDLSSQKDIEWTQHSEKKASANHDLSAVPLDLSSGHISTETLLLNWKEGKTALTAIPPDMRNERCETELSTLSGACAMRSGRKQKTQLKTMSQIFKFQDRLAKCQTTCSPPASPRKNDTRSETDSILHEETGEKRRKGDNIVNNTTEGCNSKTGQETTTEEFQRRWAKLASFDRIRQQRKEVKGSEDKKSKNMSPGRTSRHSENNAIGLVTNIQPTSSVSRTRSPIDLPDELNLKEWSDEEEYDHDAEDFGFLDSPVRRMEKEENSLFEKSPLLDLDLLEEIETNEVNAPSTVPSTENEEEGEKKNKGTKVSVCKTQKPARVGQRKNKQKKEQSNEEKCTEMEKREKRDDDSDNPDAGCTGNEAHSSKKRSTGKSGKSNGRQKNKSSPVNEQDGGRGKSSEKKGNSKKDKVSTEDDEEQLTSGEIARKILADLPERKVGIEPPYFGIEEDDLQKIVPIDEYEEYMLYGTRSILLRRRFQKRNEKKMPIFDNDLKKGEDIFITGVMQQEHTGRVKEYFTRAINRPMTQTPVRLTVKGRVLLGRFQKLLRAYMNGVLAEMEVLNSTYYSPFLHFEHLIVNDLGNILPIERCIPSKKADDSDAGSTQSRTIPDEAEEATSSRKKEKLIPKTGNNGQHNRSPKSPLVESTPSDCEGEDMIDDCIDSYFASEEEAITSARSRGSESDYTQPSDGESYCSDGMQEDSTKVKKKKVIKKVRFQECPQSEESECSPQKQKEQKRRKYKRKRDVSQHGTIGEGASGTIHSTEEVPSECDLGRLLHEQQKAAQSSTKNSNHWTETQQYAWLSVYEREMPSTAYDRNNRWKIFSAQLAQLGVVKTNEQCRAQFKTMSARFERYKTVSGASGGIVNGLHDKILKAFTHHEHVLAGITGASSSSRPGITETSSRVVKKNKNEKTETTEQAAQETSASGKGKKNGKKRPNAEERKEVSNSGGYAEEGSTETYVPPVKKKKSTSNTELMFEHIKQQDVSIANAIEKVTDLVQMQMQMQGSQQNRQTANNQQISPNPPEDTSVVNAIETITKLVQAHLQGSEERNKAENNPGQSSNGIQGSEYHRLGDMHDEEDNDMSEEEF